MTTDANPQTTNPAQGGNPADPATTGAGGGGNTAGDPAASGNATVTPVAAPSLGDTPKVDDLKVDISGSGDGKEYTYSPTGDVRLDTALGFIGKLGLGANDPAVQAARDGDFGLLKAKLASLGAKAQGWEQFVQLAESAHEDNRKATEAATAKIVEAVHGAVGGKAAWEPIQAWAKANADEGERAQINTMFAAGPIAAKAAAMYLQGLYNKAGGTVVEPASATTTHVSGQASGIAGNAPLSPAEYSKAVQELASRVGASRVSDHPEYKQLQQRRLAYRG